MDADGEKGTALAPLARRGLVLRVTRSFSLVRLFGARAADTTLGLGRAAVETTGKAVNATGAALGSAGSAVAGAAGAVAKGTLEAGRSGVRATSEALGTAGAVVGSAAAGFAEGVAKGSSAAASVVTAPVRILSEKARRLRLAAALACWAGAGLLAVFACVFLAAALRRLGEVEPVAATFALIAAVLASVALGAGLAVKPPPRR